MPKTVPESSNPQRAAGAARRPTDHPDRFVIPREELPAGFAERLSVPTEPAAPHPAATVVVLRDAPHGPETLLLRRHGRSGFAAGAWVFPGGRVDDADREERFRSRWRGPEPAAWRERLSLSDEGVALGFLVAAVRETFEETGIMVGEPRETGERERLRAELLAGERHFAEVLEAMDAAVDTGKLAYLAHWITPEAEPRRFDTRFFLAELPAKAVVEAHAEELTEARWLSPAAALAAYEAGELRMLPPTIHTLRRLTPFEDVAAVRVGLGDAPVPTFLPRLHGTAEGVVIEVVEKA